MERDTHLSSEVIRPYEATQRAWFKLRDEASRGSVSSDVPKLGDFLAYWLKEIVQPNLAPKTYQTYELFARLHIDPYLGHKRLDKLQVKDIRQHAGRAQQFRSQLRPPDCQGRCAQDHQA